MQKVLDVLRKAERPLYIAEVQRLAGIKGWKSARGILLKLVSQNLVRAIETERETVFAMAEPSISEIESLFEKSKVEVALKTGTLKHGTLVFKCGNKELETNPTDWIELTGKYNFDLLVRTFKTKLQKRGFPIKQGELLPEMKKVLKKGGSP